MFMNKNWKLMIAAAMAVCICASMVGCGENEESDHSSKNRSEMMSEIAENQSDKSSGVEEENNTDSKLYAYYGELSEEYEQNPPTHYSIAYLSENACIGTDGKIYATVEIPQCNHILISYDTETKETKTILPEVNDVCYFYWNGYVYSTHDDVLTKYDTDGNVLQTGNTGRINGDVIIMDNGMAFCNTFDNGLIMLSPDFQTITSVPAPQREIAHGLTENVKNAVISGAYRNKVFAYSHTNGGEDSNETYYSLFCFDTDTLEWHKCTEFEKSDNSDFEQSYRTIGKYLLGNSYIFDMESEEVISLNTSAISTKESALRNPYSENYLGGDYSIIYNGNNHTWYKGKYASDNTPLNLSECEAIAVTDNVPISYIIRLDDTRYIVNDEYGVFLRTYEKGEAEEETIMLFEKN